MRARVLVAEVVDVAGRDERQPELARRAPRGRGVDPLLHLEPGVLDLDVVGVGAEDVAQPRELGLARSPRLPVLERLRRRGPDRQPESAMSPAECAVEELPVDARLVVVALEEAAPRRA